MTNEQQNGTKVKVTLKKSLIGSTEAQVRVARALVLKKTNQTVEHYKNPTIMGMINKIAHLLDVTEL